MELGYGALARLGGGDLRSFVLVMGVSAYAALSGPLVWLHVMLFPPQPVATNPSGVAHSLGEVSGLPIPVIGLVVGGLLISFALSARNLRQDSKAMFWAFAVGLAITSAWAGMHYVSATGFEDLAVVSHTFSAPVGDAILYAMTASGQTLSFGVGSVAGVWIGAFLGSLIKGHFRWEACEDPRELRRQIIGAGIMGIGAVIAIGCSIGQGLSAFSLLAFGAPVTFAAIFAGAALGLRQLIVGFAATE